MTSLRHLARGLPDFVTAYALYAAWSEPARFGMEWFRASAFLMLLEFFVIHAGGFMAVTVVDPEASKRTRVFRLQPVWTQAPPTERDRSHAVTAWALSVAVWLGAVFLTVEYDVPELGVSEELRNDWGFTGGGMWESEPQRALAGGVVYFGLMGLLRPLLARAFSA